MVDINTVKDSIQENFQSYSHSKRQEVERLVYEIAKREQKNVGNIIQDARRGRKKFAEVKDYLIKRRYPEMSQETSLDQYYLPELQIDPANKVDVNQPRDIIPKKFFIEEAVADTDFAQRLHKKFPEAQFESISRYRDHIKGRRYEIADYNQRLDSFYIVKEEYDFYKKCPCSPKMVYCGYHVMNLGSGCGFECTYCYLQDYINSPGIILPANIEDFLEQFKGYKHDIRIGTGELTDSLIFDHITDYSTKIVDFFRDYPQTQFELKTKSVNIDNLLHVEGCRNVIVAWSMNPQELITTTEFYTASLEGRLQAAEKCVAHGYSVAFHFDPIIYYPNWEKGYHNLVTQIFDRIDPQYIAWVSISTLRMNARLKKIIENRFPDNKILDEELARGKDKKLRYDFTKRTEMCTKVKQWVQERAPKIYLYLCMEEKDACSSCEAGPLKKFL